MRSHTHRHTDKHTYAHGHTESIEGTHVGLEVQRRRSEAHEASKMGHRAICVQVRAYHRCGGIAYSEECVQRGALSRNSSYVFERQDLWIQNW